jgi:hypothetical protein
MYPDRFTSPKTCLPVDRPSTPRLTLHHALDHVFEIFPVSISFWSSASLIA